MRPIFFWFLVSLGICLSAQAAPPDPVNTDVDRLRAILQVERRNTGAQAVEFGMWVGDREILTTALGNSMTTVPATTSMHFRIGGITEMFQSTLAMILAEKGRIQLDDKISRWFPQLLSADRVSVRMLLANTGGYLDYVRQPEFAQAYLADPFHQYTADELIDFAVRGGKMNYPPGTSQAYSHTECLLLGEVLQKATGQPMKELYEENILTPLGLQDTRFPTDQEIQAPVLHSYISDRGIYEDATYHNASWAGAYGALTSNLHDLGRWGHAFGSGALLSPASFQEMTASSAGKGTNRPDLYFAYSFVYCNGWLFQNPNLNGYSGALGYHLASGVTLVVEATRSSQSKSDHPAFQMFRKLVDYVTPATPLKL